MELVPQIAFILFLLSIIQITMIIYLFVPTIYIDLFLLACLLRNIQLFTIDY